MLEQLFNYIKANYIKKALIIISENLKEVID